MHRIIHALLWLISWLPLRILYVLSDILLYPIIYYAVRYRKKIVRKNIKIAFPEISEKERLKIEKKFYHHFCDIFVETFALMHMSAKQINKRVSYENIDLIDLQYKKGNSVVLMTAHYANWEWGIGMSLNLEKDKPLYPIYKKLKNSFFDNFIYNLRSKYGSKNIETNDIFRTMLRLRNESKLGTFGVISDQSPTRSGIRHWAEFMGRKSAVYIGAEQLAKRFNYPIVFLKVEKTKRGHYNYSFEMIAENVNEWSDYSITEKYFEMLEEQIKQQPELWLWSHNRWKHKYEDHVKQESANAEL